MLIASSSERTRSAATLQALGKCGNSYDFRDCEGTVLECEFPSMWEMKNHGGRLRRHLRNRQTYVVNSGRQHQQVRRRQKLKLKGRMMGAYGFYASSHCGSNCAPIDSDFIGRATPDWCSGSLDAVDDWWREDCVVVNRFLTFWPVYISVMLVISCSLMSNQFI